MLRVKRADIGRPKLVALEVALRARGERHPDILASGLWVKIDHLVAAHAPIGDLGRFSDAHIATACRWEGDGSWLVAALLEAGWLLHHSEHRLVVADWWKDSDDNHHRAVARLRLHFWDGSAPRLNKMTGPERKRAEEFYGLSPSEPGLPITEAVTPGRVPMGAPSRPVPSFSSRSFPRTRAAGQCRPHESGAQSRPNDPENDGSLSRSKKGGAVALQRPVEPSWAPSPDEPRSAVAVGPQERSVASLLHEMQSRLCDRGDPSNLWAIAEQMPPAEIEGGLFVACGRAKDGLLPDGNLARYFVGCMKRRARKLGIRLDFGRRAAVGS